MHPADGHTLACCPPRNQAFARLLAQILRLKAQYPDFPIKSIRFDNAGEFVSQTFLSYCETQGIDFLPPVPEVHLQNGLAESLIKRIQLIARTLLQRSNLPVTAWGHAVLHANYLIQIRPTVRTEVSPYELLTGQKPIVTHLRTFGCAVWVPISERQSMK